MQYYKTVKEYAREEIIIKKSRFIASVKPVEKEEDAENFINGIKKEFHDAAHNVFAYRMGSGGEFEKHHDDGEPGGTAGKPILEVIKNEALNDLVVVVTRYFGGIYLGAGGLVRAYSKAAQAGIKKAGIGKKFLFTQVEIIIDYSAWGKLQNELKKISAVILDTHYSSVVSLETLILPDKLDYMKGLVSELTGGTGVVNELCEMYHVTEG